MGQIFVIVNDSEDISASSAATNNIKLSKISTRMNTHWNSIFLNKLDISKKTKIVSMQMIFLEYGKIEQKTKSNKSDVHYFRFIYRVGVAFLPFYFGS